MSYLEHQRVPAAWSAGLLGLALSLVVAVWAVLGHIWGVGSLIAVTLLVAWGLWAWGQARIELDEQWLRVGRARIERRYLAAAQPLWADEAQAARRSGRTDEWLHLRPWLPALVRVDVNDPADRHRHWLIASRDPQGLADQLHSLTSCTRGGG